MAGPNFFEDIFDFEKIPAFQFENSNSKIPKNFWITDTSFRDGQQSRNPYKVEDIVELFKYLHLLGGSKGIIKQTEFFLYSKNDKLAIEKCKDLNYVYPEITGWIRADKEDFKLVKKIELSETGILTSVSDYHIFLKLKSDRKKILKKYLKIVDLSIENGVIPRCHFEDITRADFNFVILFAQELKKRNEETKIPVKIRMSDTLGLGLPYHEVNLPRSIPRIVDALIHEAGFSGELLEWHGHNDFHKALINGTTAWLNGCSAVNGTLLGFGERTGNSPIEALIMDYIALNGGDPEKLGIDTKIIAKIATYYKEKIGDRIPKNYPFVGEEFNTTRAGIHLDGLNKNDMVYNVFNTNKLLDRVVNIAITDKSGAAGIAYWLNYHFNLKNDLKIDKKDKGVRSIYKSILAEFDNGRTIPITADEMIKLAKQHLPFLLKYESGSKSG